MSVAAALVERSCPVCGSSADSRVIAGAKVDASRLDEFAFASRKTPEYMHHRLLVCAPCDCLYASPAPPPEATAPAYENASFDSQVESHYAARTYARLLSKLATRLPDRVSALDVGTGDGAFLEELLSLGFKDVVGVEPSSAPIAVSKEEIRPLIRHGEFDAQRFEPGRFSLVTCFQTLEHLHDPRAMCEAASRLLKPGGAFFVVCHNRRALSARVMGMKSPIFDIEHLQLFSPASLTRLLECSGFEDVMVTPVWNSYPLHYWMKLAPLPGGLKRVVMATGKTTGAGRLPIALPAGNIAAVATKRRTTS